MSAVAKQFMLCANCGKRFVWQAAMVGKRVHCICGHLLEAPAETTEPPSMAPIMPAPAAGRFDLPEPSPPRLVEPAPGADLYDLIEPVAPAPLVARSVTKPPAFIAPLDLDDDGLCCPCCDHAMEPGTVVCSMCGFNFRTGQRPLAAPKAARLPPPFKPATRSKASAAQHPLPARRPGERYTMQPADSPLRWIILGSVIVVILLAALLWHLLATPAAKPLNSGKGQDPQVNEMIADDGATEVHKWFEEDPNRLAGEFSPKQAMATADKLQAMGAKKLLAFGTMMTLSLAVELPKNPAERATLFKWENKFAITHMYKPDKDVGQYWLLLRLHP